MRKILIVVDMQNGFARYKQTEDIGNKIEKLLKKNLFDSVIATKFINNYNSIYDYFLGWTGLIHEEERTLYGDIEKYSDIVVDKMIYTCINPTFIKELYNINDEKQPSEIFIVGVDTDCCVMKISVDLFENGIRPIVLSQYCNSNGGLDSHLAGLKCLERTIGKMNIIDLEISSKTDLDNIIESLSNNSK